MSHCDRWAQTQRGGEEALSLTYLVSLSDFKLSGDPCRKPQGARREGVRRVRHPSSLGGERTLLPQSTLGGCAHPCTGHRAPPALHYETRAVSSDAGASLAGAQDHVTSALWLRERLGRMLGTCAWCQ